MEETQELRAGQIVQYTDTKGRKHDAIVDQVIKNAIVIKYQPRGVTRWRMVDRLTLEIPE